jgi:hypothetical protein
VEYPFSIVPNVGSFERSAPLKYSYLIGDGVSQSVNSLHSRPVLEDYSFTVSPLLNQSCSIHFQSQSNTQLSYKKSGMIYSATSYLYDGVSQLDVSICDVHGSPLDSPFIFIVRASNLQFNVFVTTSANSELVPLQSLFLLESMNILSGSPYISITSPLPCGIAQVWSSLSSSPLNPPQPFLFSSNVSFPDILWTLANHSTGEDNVIYTYLLLDEESEDSAEEIMNKFSFSIGPGLFNENQLPLASGEPIYSTIKENITCNASDIKSLLIELNETIDHIIRGGSSNVNSLYSDLVFLDIIQTNVAWIACGKQISYLSQTETISSSCDEFNCTSLFFENYLRNVQQVDNGLCNDASYVQNPLVDASWYKACKESVYSVSTGKKGRPCISDEDCSFPWGNSSHNLTYSAYGSVCPFPLNSTTAPPCDTIIGICSDTQDLAETMFWWCFVSKMSAPFQLSVASRVDPCNIAQLRSEFTSNDCVALSGTGMDALRYRSRYSYAQPPVRVLFDSEGVVENPLADHCACYQAVGNEYDLCLDELCNKPPPCEYNSYDRIPGNLIIPTDNLSNEEICIFSYVYETSDFSCRNQSSCNWNPSLDGTTDCHSISEIFCGIHFNIHDSFYHEIVNVTEGECGYHNASACVTPLGAIELEVYTSNGCEEIGYCTAGCPNHDGAMKCLPVDRTQPSLCYNDHAEITLIVCQQRSGQWVHLAGQSVCVFPLQNTPSECRRNGNIFIDCHSFSEDLCESSPLLACYLSNSSTSCATKQDCELHGVSRCTDDEYFMNWLTRPPTNGSCLLPFLQDPSDSWRRYCYQHTIPMSLGCVLKTLQSADVLLLIRLFFS